LVRKTLAACDPKTEYVQTMARRGYRFARCGFFRRRRDRNAARAAADAICAQWHVNIAYQVIGNGPIDLVFVMGWVSIWRCSGLSRRSRVF